jgi:hypothetical protein
VVNLEALLLQLVTQSLQQLQGELGRRWRPRCGLLRGPAAPHPAATRAHWHSIRRTQQERPAVSWWGIGLNDLKTGLNFCKSSQLRGG